MPTEPEESVRAPVTGLTGSYELLCVLATDPGPLQEEPLLLSLGSALQLWGQCSSPRNTIFSSAVVVCFQYFLVLVRYIRCV